MQNSDSLDSLGRKNAPYVVLELLWFDYILLLSCPLYLFGFSDSTPDNLYSIGYRAQKEGKIEIIFCFVLLVFREKG
jgi:hypothetical protein